jgi:hypothetical protein
MMARVPMSTQSDLDAIMAMPVGERIERLRVLSPEKADALELLVNLALRETWQDTFHNGPRGGLRLKSQVQKGGRNDAR